jgi:uncharacterized protein (TIGR02145 family)
MNKHRSGANQPSFAFPLAWQGELTGNRSSFMSKTVSKLALAAGVVLAMVFTFSCSPPDDGGDGSYTGSYGSVTYEGQTYKTVRIGTQTWFAENLNYDHGTSACYENQASNCVTYGRLYDWATAMGFPESCNMNECSDQIQSKHQGICPSGWHIPSNAEWDRLYRYVDGTSGTKSPYGSSTAGRYLKATSGWKEYQGKSGNGTDKYGFSALPGSGGYSVDDFGSVSMGYIGDIGHWWSANEYAGGGGYSRSMGYDSEAANLVYSTKSFLYSVRCLQD